MRVYLFCSTQHSPGVRENISSGRTTNGNSYFENLRALHVALGDWVLKGAEPPASVYPTILKKTLVASNKTTSGWRDIPGVTYSGKTNEGSDLDFGEAFNEKDESGVLREPPVVFKQKYTILVPKVNADDNETDGVRSVTLRAPLGTYTGWSLRKEGFGEGDLNGLDGMFVAFKTTKAERLAAGDARLSLEERYGTHAGYVAAVKKAVEASVKEGFLLPEDAQSEIGKAEKSNVLEHK